MILKLISQAKTVQSRENRDLLSKFKYVLKPRASRAGIIMVLAIVLLLAVGPFVIRYSPYAISPSINSAPSLSHPFGTDYRGRDIFSQVVWGAQVSLLVAVIASIGSVILGTFAGIVSGYSEKLESPVSGLSDMVLALPALPFLILLGLLFQPTDALITSILIIVLWAPLSRAIRAQVSSIKKLRYVDAARISGYSSFGIVFRIILPEIIPISMAYVVINTASSIIIVTALEFLGVGNVDIVSWGSILYWAQQFGFYAGDWWWILAPGLVISFFATGLALIGYAVEELSNPRLRS